MCGISGIVDLKGSGFSDVSNLTLITNAIKHRGPDDEGYYIVGREGQTTELRSDDSDETLGQLTHISDFSQEFKLGFGHRRLSIIDTSSAGHQPMLNNTGDYCIVFNGAVYNYIELREELQSKGYEFKSDTDTEVVLNAYIEWGREALDRFNGMFAFVIYDKKSQELFGARDRTGVKPMYYYVAEGKFAFASELKALQKLDGIGDNVNQAAAFDFLVLNKMERTDDSIFSNIKELSQSHFFIYNLQSGVLNVCRYFTPTYNSERTSLSSDKEKNYIEKTKELIESSIKLRLRADVKIGSALSGGIDSSSIVCQISELLKHGGVKDMQNVFTSSFKESSIDESKWAKLVVENTGVHWNQTFPKANDLLRNLEDMVYSQDIPLRSTSTYAQYAVMKLVKENGVKVILDGQGGDELFAGYHQHLHIYWKDLLKHGRVKELANQGKQYGLSFRKMLKVISKFSLKHNYLKKLSAQKRHAMELKYYNEFNYLSKDFLQQNLGGYKQDRDVQKNLNEMLSYEYYDGPLKELLKCEDRNSMRFGIESRTPFADDINLMDNQFQIPSVYKLKGGVTKHLLRESMKELIPSSIYNRKDKLGFVTPNNQWIRSIKSDLRHYFEEDNSGILDSKAILRDFDVLFNPKSDRENYRLFKLISFCVWHKVFMGKK